MMDRFLSYGGELSERINTASQELFSDLNRLRIKDLDIPEQCRPYLESSHFNRLFFSIQTSAHLLYRAINRKGSMPESMVMMDYGAGVGTLFLLAKKIGFKTVIYNDHLEDWKQSAKVIAEACNIQIDFYIVGDIDKTLQEISEKGLVCDLITSRNVIEHIYKLDHFFDEVYKASADTLIFNSTTANIKNPASRIKHILWHNKWEKNYRQQRYERIISKGISEQDAKNLAAATQGLAVDDIDNAIAEFKTSGKFIRVKNVRSNTCDPSNGVWAEHLLTYDEYRQLADSRKYSIEFEPGFWDSHYKKTWKNLLGKTMNMVGKIGKSAGFLTASFIYVIAEPKK
ncbi:MAG: methyltransferase domain-containing protein [Flavitalea sp.]